MGANGTNRLGGSGEYLSGLSGERWLPSVQLGHGRGAVGEGSVGATRDRISRDPAERLVPSAVSCVSSRPVGREQTSPPPMERGWWDRRVGRRSGRTRVGPGRRSDLVVERTP